MGISEIDDLKPGPHHAQVDPPDGIHNVPLFAWEGENTSAIGSAMAVVKDGQITSMTIAIDASVAKDYGIELTFTDYGTRINGQKFCVIAKMYER